MEEALAPYGHPGILVPMLAMFTIIFGIVLSVMRRDGPLRDLLPGGRGVAVALCVSILAMWGMDQAVVRLVAMSYGALGVAILIGLAAMLGAAWAAIVIKGRRKGE